MSLLKIAELEGQIKRRDDRILELEATVETLTERNALFVLDILDDNTLANLAAERDAEIERLKYTVKRRDVGIEICATLSVKMEAKLAAQRKVLEQAREALELSWPMRGRYISTTEFETDCAKHQAAITAIQEQLK